MSAEVNSNSVNGDWLKFFSDAGVPWEVRTLYTDLFVKNHIRSDILKELNKELLQDMGIKPVGDIILILRHIRELSSEEALEKTAATSSGCSIANVAKVRPQANISITEHSQGPTPPTHGGVSRSPIGQSAGRVRQKVPRKKNVHQPLIQRSQSAVTTGSVDAPRNTGLGLSKKGTIANVVNVSNSTPSNKLKAANMGSSTSVKLRRPPTLSKTQNAATGTELEINSKGEGHVIEDSAPFKPRVKQDNNASCMQNISIPTAKKVISVSNNTGTSSYKHKLVNNVPMKSQLVGTSASVVSAPVNSTCKGTVEPKGILKTGVSSVPINRVKRGQLAVTTSRPTIVRKNTEAGKELQVAEGSGSGMGAASVATSVNTPKSLTSQNSGTKQRIVCMAVTLPTDEEEEEDDTQAEASGSDVKISHEQGAGGSGAGPNSLAVQRKNIVSLRSVKYGNEAAVLPMQKVGKVLPEYEGMYTIIMPKKTKLSKPAAVPTENIEDGIRETFVCSDKCGMVIQNGVESLAEEQNEDMYYEECVEKSIEDDLCKGLSENEVDELLDEADLGFEVQPGNNTLSVFDRLGWKNQENFRQKSKSFRRYSSSLHHYMNHKPDSVFSRLGFAMTRHVNPRSYRARNSYNIRQQADRPSECNLSVPGTHVTKKIKCQKNKGPSLVNQRTVNMKRTKMPLDSSIGNVPTIPARKAVRFGTKEELRYIINTENSPKPKRRPLPGSITLRTGIFEKFNT